MCPRELVSVRKRMNEISFNIRIAEGNGVRNKHPVVLFSISLFRGWSMYSSTVKYTLPTSCCLKGINIRHLSVSRRTGDQLRTYPTRLVSNQESPKESKLKKGCVHTKPSIRHCVPM